MELKGIFILFITVIVGIVLFSAIADTIFGVTNTFGVTNETLDITNARTGGANSIDESIGLNVTIRTSGLTLRDVSAIRMENGTAFVDVTDYIDNSTGDQYVYFKNTTTLIDYTNNDTFVDYTYEPSTYVTNATARTLVNLIPIFFAIAILVFVAFYVSKRFQFI